MKNYLFAVAMLGLTSVASQAVLADACTDCTNENNSTILDCENNWMLSVAECENIICPKVCPIPTTSKHLKK